MNKNFKYVNVIINEKDSDIEVTSRLLLYFLKRSKSIKAGVLSPDQSENLYNYLCRINPIAVIDLWKLWAVELPSMATLWHDSKKKHSKLIQDSEVSQSSMDLAQRKSLEAKPILEWLPCPFCGWVPTYFGRNIYQDQLVKVCYHPQSDTCGLSHGVFNERQWHRRAKITK